MTEASERWKCGSPTISRFMEWANGNGRRAFKTKQTKTKKKYNKRLFWNGFTIGGWNITNVEGKAPVCWATPLVWWDDLVLHHLRMEWSRTGERWGRATPHPPAEPSGPHSAAATQHAHPSLGPQRPESAEPRGVRSTRAWPPAAIRAGCAHLNSMQHRFLESISFLWGRRHFRGRSKTKRNRGLNHRSFVHPRGGQNKPDEFKFDRVMLISQGACFYTVPLITIYAEYSSRQFQLGSQYLQV